MSNIVTLKNVDLGKLKEAFGRSLSISSSDALNFRLTKDAISNVAEHSSKSLYKQWSVKTSDICEAIEGDFVELKTAVYAGTELTSKIFGFFGQCADLSFHHLDGNVSKIEIVKRDEKNRVALRIVLVTASVKTTFIELDKELINHIFNAENPKVELLLKPDDLKQLNRLSKLSTNPENQTAYISISSKDNQLTATDGAFDIALYDTDIIVEQIDIDKELFSCIEQENYVASVYTTDAGSMMILRSNDSDSQIAVVLLSNADDSINWDEFETGGANWDKKSE